MTLPVDIGIAPCSGRNCGTTTGKHSVDCGLEHTMSCFGVDEAVRVEVWEALDALRLSATARDVALLQAQRDLQDCHMAFLNNIKSPAAHDRYAGIAERGIEAIGAALTREPK